MPRQFFNTVVGPGYQSWLGSPLEEWRAKNAVHEANVMAERVFHHWRNSNDALIHHASTAGAYRRELNTRECPDFRIVWDIDDAHRHMRITRRPASVSANRQTAVQTAGYGMLPYGEGVYGGTEQIVVVLDDGSQRALTAVMANVIAMWERVLRRMGI